jgi:hypothetical protein
MEGNQSVQPANESSGKNNRTKLSNLQEQAQRLKDERSELDSTFEEITYYVRNNTFVTNGLAEWNQKRTRNEIFDPTAPWASVQAANGLGSFLTNNSDRWFGLGVMGRPIQKLAKESRIWLEMVEDRIYHEYSIPQVGFGSAMSEVYLDLTQLGTAILFQDWDPKGQHVRFLPRTINNTWIGENNFRVVDTILSEWPINKRQLIQWFPDFADHPKVKADDWNTKSTLKQLVFPNSDYDIYKVGQRGNWKFTSVYYSDYYELIFDEGGFNQFPYHCPRWLRIVGEVYGQSMAMQCLPAIQNANQIMEELHISARLANWPPISYDDDSIVMPMNQTHPEFYPGSLIAKIQGTENPQPIHSGTQPQYSHELLQMQQKWITDAFHVSYLLRERKKERQSVLEIQDERSEMLRQMGSSIGRQHQELIGPMVGRTYNLLRIHRKIPPPPPEIAEAGLDVTFTNPAAKAQLGSKAGAMGAFLQDLAVIAQAKPEIWDVIKPIEWAEELANVRDVSQRVINSKSEWEQIQMAKSQQAEQAQMMDQLPGMAKGMKDIAQARDIDPTMAGLLN